MSNAVTLAPPKPVDISLRLDGPLAERIDRYVEQLGRAAKIPPRKPDILRALLTAGLDAEGA